MRKAIRVLHVLPTLTGGGAEGFVASLLPHLRDRDIEPGVMAMYPTAIPENLAGSNAIPLIRIERTGRYDPWFFFRIVAAMRQWKPAVVHTHMHNGKYWGRLAAIICGVPVVVHTAHNPCNVNRLAVETFADRALNIKTAAIVTFFEQQRRFLASFERVSLNKVRVIANGIVHQPIPSDDDRRHARQILRAGQDDFIIFVVGRIERLKNQELAVRALGELPVSARHRTRFCILGTGPDKSLLERLCNELDLTAHIDLLGFRTDVPQLLAGADLMFMPSLSEGMPLALIEAMSAGVPVLTTPWIGAAELLADGKLGTIAEDWEPRTAARHIVEIMQSYPEVNSKALVAQQKVRSEYGIEKTASGHRALYRELVSKAGSSAA